MHHMYVQAAKDPTQQWTQMSYRVTTEEVGPKLTDWVQGDEQGHPWPGSDLGGGEKEPNR
jgi:hypothetical protein